MAARLAQPMSPRLYADLASWWPLLSDPEDYRAEARLVLDLLSCVLGGPPGSLLELGSGGGHLACHLPAALEVVLLDLSPTMLEVSRQRNPVRAHVLADMRQAELGRRFDAVLLHDAAMYLLEAEDLAQACGVAAAHLRPGGAFLMLPDVVAEEFEEGTVTGGGEAPDGRAARLTEWVWDPDPQDGRYRVDMSLLLRDADGTMRAVHDVHEMALRSRAQWWAGVRAAGLVPVEAPPLLAARFGGEVFLARKPGNGG